MKKLRIGFIGCSTRTKSLMKTCVTVKGVRITALCDKFASLVKERVDQLEDPDVKTYTDHEQMLAEAPIDAVYVVVEPENCPDLVVASLEAGKHVLSEVPMAFDLEAVWRIVLAAERTGMKYMLGEQTRYMPHFAKWKELVDDGSLGKIVYAEGQYLHGMPGSRYYLDPATGAQLSLEEAAAHPNPLKSRFWHMPHPILYLPHELSPLLRVLGDRVASVTCMGTNKNQSYVHDFFPRPDFETALMHTAGDTVMRLSAEFTIHQIHRNITGNHWYSLVGTKGSVETHRTNQDKMKLFIPGDDEKKEPEEAWWEYDKTNTPKEILESGHSGGDYWPIRHFIDAVMDDKDPAMDVYAAAESAAPAIVAAGSAELDGTRLVVPDFRPGSARKAGQDPPEDMKHVG